MKEIEFWNKIDKNKTLDFIEDDNDLEKIYFKIYSKLANSLNDLLKKSVLIEPIYDLDDSQIEFFNKIILLGKKEFEFYCNNPKRLLLKSFNKIYK